MQSCRVLCLVLVALSGAVQHHAGFPGPEPRLYRGREFSRSLVQDAQLADRKHHEVRDRLWLARRIEFETGIPEHGKQVLALSRDKDP